MMKLYKDSNIGKQYENYNIFTLLITWCLNTRGYLIVSSNVNNRNHWNYFFDRLNELFIQNL